MQNYNAYYTKLQVNYTAYYTKSQLYCIGFPFLTPTVGQDSCFHMNCHHGDKHDFVWIYVKKRLSLLWLLKVISDHKHYKSNESYLSYLQPPIHKGRLKVSRPERKIIEENVFTPKLHKGPH